MYINFHYKMLLFRVCVRGFASSTLTTFASPICLEKPQSVALIMWKCLAVTVYNVYQGVRSVDDLL